MMASLQQKVVSLAVGSFFSQPVGCKSTYQGSGDPMPYRKYIVSTRTLFRLTATLILMFFVGGVGAARAANNGSAPELIPFEINIIAGNNHGLAGGYGGDGQLAESPVLDATPSTVNGPAASGTDSVGNVYIADTSNDVIREINAQTGIITSIAGVPPSACTGTICTNHTTGCADGVPALDRK